MHSPAALQLLQPGEWLHRDYRPSAASSVSRSVDVVSATASVAVPSAPSPPPPPRSLRVVQWNIERGYALTAIIAELRALDADVIALQEVDVACERSGSVDVGDAIARALRMRFAYVCEFHELHSPLRSARLQGGERGHHGHALLTRFDVDTALCSTLRHSHQPVDWEKEGASRGEPRRGERVTMKAVVRLPGGAELLLYNGHFEVFCGLLDRAEVLADVLQDARAETQRHPNQLLLADCNTMAHGIARLSPLYCTDAMRWRSLGWTEAEWWRHFILDVADAAGPINERLRPFLPAHSPLLSALRNPGFVDPFDPYDDVTLINYRGLYQARLDWTLVRGPALTVQRAMLGNHHYAASDHKWMALDLRMAEAAQRQSEQQQQQPQHAHQYQRHRKRRRPGLCTCTTDDRVCAVQWLLLLSAVIALLAYAFARHL